MATKHEGATAPLPVEIVDRRPPAYIHMLDGIELPDRGWVKPGGRVQILDWNGSKLVGDVRSVSRHRESQCVHVDLFVDHEFRTLPVERVVKVL